MLTLRGYTLTIDDDPADILHAIDEYGYAISIAREHPFRNRRYIRELIELHDAGCALLDEQKLREWDFDPEP